MFMQRLDKEMQARGLVSTRSQAENFIKLGLVRVNGKTETKSGHSIRPGDKIVLAASNNYVSRAALKLKSVSEQLKINYKDKIVLDIGSSTGGFTEYSLEQGAKQVIAVDVGSDQLHPKLRTNNKIFLYEKTDIRKVSKKPKVGFIKISEPDLILMDLSFISLRQIIPHVVSEIAGKNTLIIAMLKPQFEAGDKYKHKGVIKNDKMRRQILKEFEDWLMNYAVIIDKADSRVAGSKGNLERFYKLSVVH